MVFIVGCLFSLNVSAGKFYKWVDKDGTVHYTQTPPEKSMLKDESALSVKKDASAIPVRRKGDYAYCGDMKLPGPLYEPKSILMGLGERIESWEKSLEASENLLESQLRSLDRENKQKNRYSTNSYSDYAKTSDDRRRETARQIKEYKCAIDWAQKQKEKYADITDEIAHDLKGAKVLYQKAIDTAREDCGYEPKDYQDPNYNAKKLDWVKCMRPHDRKVNSARNTLNTLRRQSGSLE